MKLYATKNVLSEGIREVEADDDVVSMLRLNETNPARRSVCAVCRQGGREVTLWLDGENREWHATMAGAIRRAERMREERVASLQKQIKRIEGLQFG